MGNCTNPANHENHICQMKLQQKLKEVRDLSKGATHFCKNCESPSYQVENLCDPQPFKGGAGILKWK